MSSGSFQPRATKYARIAAHYGSLAGHRWLAEFLDLFPERTAKWLVGPSRVSLVLTREGDDLVLELLDGERPADASVKLKAADVSARAIDEFLLRQGIRRCDADIVLRLPQEMFFCRKLILPAQAAASVDEIITADLVRRTPFRLQDVYHGHATTVPEPSGKFVVWQWLVRRTFVRDAALAFELSVDDVHFVDSRGDTVGPRPLIELHANAKKRPSGIKRSMLAMLISAGMLGIATAVLEYQRQEAMIEANDSRIAIARVQAQKLRSEFDRVQERQNVLLRLRSQRRDVPGLLDLWEEVTRVLPVHSWLTELRLSEVPEKSEHLVTMNGFSARATDLVKLIDHSPLLADASLTAPVTIDPVEGRERFVLQAKVKRSNPLQEAAR
ncbi:MAG: hypothetical protein JO228_09375 [Xanthobacteraceae bacterium]|nr:hypothetical protein [Xanthobacteraceae bacterium]